MVDAHVHFWDPAEIDYGWLSPALGDLYRAYAPQHLEADRSAHALSAAVVVQAAHSVRETEQLLGLAETHDWLGAVVGWVPLERPAEAARVLEELTDRPRFRGVRHLVFREELDWLVSPSVVESIALLDAAGLVLEVPAATVHLEHVAALAARFPDLCIVIDHLGQPPRAGTPEYAAWHDALVKVAEHDNVSAKMSGLHAVDRHGADVEAAVRAASRAFGGERLMFGSDWPVCLASGTYADVVRRTLRALSTTSPSERAAVMSETACRVYGLAPQREPPLT